MHPKSKTVDLDLEVDYNGNTSTCSAMVTVESETFDCGLVKLNAAPDALSFVVCPGGNIAGEIDLFANDNFTRENVNFDVPGNLPEGVTITDGVLSYVNEEASEAVLTFVYAVCHTANAENCDTAQVSIEILMDSDCDGVADITDIDDDDDGLLDIHEQDPSKPAGEEDIDTDGDGVVDRLDIDSDNDGIADNHEWQQTIAEGDHHVEKFPGSSHYGFDYYPPLGTDSDGDGWDDQYDDNSQNIYYPAWDMDLDGTPDHLDTDTDDDGYPDLVEGHDENHDKIADITPSGIDSDGDGLDDAFDDHHHIGSNEVGKNAKSHKAKLQDKEANGVRDWREAELVVPPPPPPPVLTLFIPEGFSPNNDNKNDYFEIQLNEDDTDNVLFGENYPEAKLYVYNRWGNLLFEKENYGNYNVWGSKVDAWWDGESDHAWTIGGNKVPSGTYIYVLILEPDNVEKGTVFVNY